MDSFKIFFFFFFFFLLCNFSVNIHWHVKSCINISVHHRSNCINLHFSCWDAQKRWSSRQVWSEGTYVSVGVVSFCFGYSEPYVVFRISIAFQWPSCVQYQTRHYFIKSLSVCVCVFKEGLLHRLIFTYCNFFLLYKIFLAFLPHLLTMSVSVRIKQQPRCIKHFAFSYLLYNFYITVNFQVKPSFVIGSSHGGFLTGFILIV